MKEFVKKIKDELKNGWKSKCLFSLIVNHILSYFSNQAKTVNFFEPVILPQWLLIEFVGYKFIKTPLIQNSNFIIPQTWHFRIEQYRILNVLLRETFTDNGSIKSSTFFKSIRSNTIQVAGPKRWELLSSDGAGRYQGKVSDIFLDHMVCNMVHRWIFAHRYSFPAVQSAIHKLPIGHNLGYM